MIKINFCLHQIRCILYILCLTSIIGCNTNKRESLTITDVTKKQSFTLRANPNDKHVWSVYLNITSELNGRAKIYSGYDTVKPFYSYDIPAGKVNTEKHSDWYSNKLILTFEPVDCTSGAINIEYEFGSD